MSRPAHVCPRGPSFGLLVTFLLVGVLIAGCREEGTIEVSKIAFEGVKQIDAGRLKGALVTKESSRFPWGENRYFDRSRFDADLKRITAFYADRGFPDARVRNVDVKLNDAQDAVSITIAVDEGQPVVVTGVRYLGFEVLPERALQRLERSSALVEGKPLDRLAFTATHDAGVNALREHGYPYATVAAADQPQGDPKHVVVTYTATPGTLGSFGPIEIVGESSVGEDVIRRELHYEPGDRYRRSRLLDSQRSLYDLELFEFANVEAVTKEGQPAQVPTRVTVAEGKHRRMNFGVGYGTEEKARVDARWQHANFFGGARTANLNARWSSLDRGVKGDFSQPYFLGRHMSFGLSGIAWNASEPAYSTDNFGGRATLRYQPSRRSSASVSFVTEYIRSAVTDEALEDFTIRDDLIALGLDPTDGTQAGTRVGFEVDLQRTTAPNLLDARRGYFASFHLEQAGGIFPGSFEYYSVSGDLRHYLSLHRRAVWANRVQIGGIRSTHPQDDVVDSASSIPFGKRYFLGGSTSVRGWGRFEVSPLNDAGLPVGGLSLFEFSSELRLRVTQKMSLVGFLDGGNVWAKSFYYDFDTLRYAAGPGIRYVTPVGPVRVDFGYQLNPIPGLLVDGEPEKRHWRVHFSIGQAF
jgi:outer membrane protein assembly complex protein YaeT